MREQCILTAFTAISLITGVEQAQSVDRREGHLAECPDPEADTCSLGGHEERGSYGPFEAYDIGDHDIEFSCNVRKSGADMFAITTGGKVMNKSLIVIAAVAVLALGSPAFAKGCIKGAAVGAVGGHLVGKGHAVAGAAAGCAVGHHRAAKKAKAD